MMGNIAVNGTTGQNIFDAVKRFRPNGPFFVPEFYPGWLDHWGEPHAHVEADSSAKDLEWILGHGISVNLYMFHGGTNFGFMNGANYGGRFQPQPTSYDYDAPLDEGGRPTPKYFKFRDVIARHLPPGVTIPNLPDPVPTIAIPRFELRDGAGLFDLATKPIHSIHPLTMEDIGQSYGYILYRTSLDSPMKGELRITGLRDYAIVFLDGLKIGSLDRRHKQSKLSFEVKESPARLDIRGKFILDQIGEDQRKSEAEPC